MKFAKIIELENGEQVLACIGIDNDTKDDGFRMNFITNIDGVTFNIGLGWNTAEERDGYLDKFDIEMAKQIRAAAEDTIDENNEKP